MLVLFSVIASFRKLTVFAVVLCRCNFYRKKLSMLLFCLYFSKIKTKKVVLETRGDKFVNVGCVLCVCAYVCEYPS